MKKMYNHRNGKQNEVETTWVELDKGEFVPAKHYKDYLHFEDEKHLNEIDWKKVPIVKKDMVKKKKDFARPGEVAYHDKYGYLLLDKAVSNDKSVWECEYIKKRDGNDNRLHLPILELKFYIMIEIKMQIDN